MAINSISQATPQLRANAGLTARPVDGDQQPGRSVSQGDSASFSSRPIIDLSSIRSLQNINDITSQGLGYFTYDNMPSFQYQSTRTRNNKDGTQTSYTVYNWGAAFADVRAKLTAISAIAGNEPDNTCRQIAQMATMALMQNNFEQALDTGSNASRYVALSVALRNIQTLTNDTPAQPSATVNSMNNAINGAQGTINDLRRQLADGTISSRDLDAKVAAKVKADNDGVAAIPTWKKFAGVGLVQQHNFNSDAKAVQEDLAAIKGANPDALQGRLNQDKQRAGGVQQQASNVRYIEEARALANSASPVKGDAKAVDGEAGGLRDKVNDLIKRLNGK